MKSKNEPRSSRLHSIHEGLGLLLLLLLRELQIISGRFSQPFWVETAFFFLFYTYCCVSEEISRMWRAWLTVSRCITSTEPHFWLHSTTAANHQSLQVVELITIGSWWFNFVNWVFFFFWCIAQKIRKKANMYTYTIQSILFSLLYVCMYVWCIYISISKE